MRFFDLCPDCITKNPNFFCNMKLFFSVQLGHLKLSGYGLLSTQGVQNRSQNCWIVSQSEVTLQYMRDPGAPAASRSKGDTQVTGQLLRNGTGTLILACLAVRTVYFI